MDASGSLALGRTSTRRVFCPGLRSPPGAVFQPSATAGPAARAGAAPAPAAPPRSSARCAPPPRPLAVLAGHQPRAQVARQRQQLRRLQLRRAAPPPLRAGGRPAAGAPPPPAGRRARRAGGTRAGTARLPPQRRPGWRLGREGIRFQAVGLAVNTPVSRTQLVVLLPLGSA